MISEKELSFFGMEPRSKVFLRDGRIVRTGVGRALAEELMASHAIGALIGDGSLVDTRIADVELGDCTLEHHRIQPFVYPGEWSFSMLRDAGLLTLHVQSALQPEGLQLKDAHSYNVTFEGVRPVFVDFASIERADPGFNQWHAAAEYVDAFIRILRIWSSTNRTTALSYLNAVWARRDDESLVRNGRQSFYRTRRKIGRAFDKALVATAMTRQARAVALENFGMKVWKRRMAWPALDAMELGMKVVGHPFELSALRKATEAIPAPQGATLWADYHDELGLHGAPTPRFQRIIDIVARLGVDDAFEVGCNQGAFAEELIARRAVKSVVCADYDEHAVDSFYLRVKSKGLTGLVPMVRNIMLPDPIRCDAVRNMSADIVIALALTHHLLLSQNYRLDVVLTRIAAYGRKYMIVEFMPRGLWYLGVGKPVPSWYTQGWFEEGLRRVGSIVLAEQLEENRVLFVVKLPHR